MYELKPCPFCGGEAGVVRHAYDARNDVFGVECTVCGCSTQQNYKHRLGAVGVWNRRASDASHRRG